MVPRSHGTVLVPLPLPVPLWSRCALSVDAARTLTGLLPATHRASMSPDFGRSYAAPSAGHTPYTASWTSTLTRSGQIHSWRPQTTVSGKRGGPPIPTHLRPPWNERIPVWEQRIPQYDTSLMGSPMRARSLATSRPGTFNPYASDASSASKSVSLPHVCPCPCLLLTPRPHPLTLANPCSLRRSKSSRATGRCSSPPVASTLSSAARGPVRIPLCAHASPTRARGPPAW